MAPVDSIQRLAVSTKLLRPACFLIPSNSMGLKSGLFSYSQMPRNSMVLRLRSQSRRAVHKRRVRRFA